MGIKMAFNLLRRNHSVFQSLIEGLDEMERQGVDRVVLTLYESEPSQSVTGKWINPEDHNYYPFEMLNEKEREMIRKEKSYTTVALVRKNVANLVRYPDRGVELCHRTNISLCSPALKPESVLNYITKNGVHVGEEIQQFAKYAIKSGWTSDMIEQRVLAGIQEYHTITRKLMENGEVYNTLKRMEERKYSPFEQIMTDMRDQITAAKCK